MRALVLVTYRSDELHRRHPFLPTLRAWRRGEIAELVNLEPLPEVGIAEMVAAISGDGGAEPELVDLLYERTEGNPFFVEEMLSEAIASLARGGELTRAAVEEVGIPETVRDTILQRLARLDPERVAILEAAAVLGRGFDYPTLLAVSGADETAVQGALEAAIASSWSRTIPTARATTAGATPSPRRRSTRASSSRGARRSTRAPPTCSPPRQQAARSTSPITCSAPRASRRRFRSA